MPSTRRSARIASSQNSSSPAKDESPQAATGSKRKSDTGSSPAPKRGKKDVPKNQTTIEESMDIDQPEGNVTRNEPQTESQSQEPYRKPESNSVEDDQIAERLNGSSAAKAEDKADGQSERGPQPSQSHSSGSTVDNAKSSQAGSQPHEQSHHEQTEQPDAQAKNTQTASPPNKPEKSTPDQSAKASNEQSAKEPEQNDSEQVRPKHTMAAAESKSHDAADAQPNGKTEEKPSTNGTAVESHARDSETPSSILEKGLVYFFFRGRVGIDNPSDVQDIARSHIVLRPLPHGAKLGEGAIGPSDNKCRLLALPKKVLPTSGKDRFMTFVEKAQTSFPELKKSFLPADDYETKTAGVRHTPPAKPIAEGVYAITTTGRENHLAYMLTIPSQLGDVQKDMGLREQGSFVVSCKNPQFPGPSYASLPQSPDYPKEVLDEFRSLRWMPLQPKHLDYENTQFLLIGETGGLDKATDVPEDQQKQSEDTPKEEIERLEGEDEIRVKHLKGDDAIFEDLGVSKKDYAEVPTTWDE